MYFNKKSRFLYISGFFIYIFYKLKRLLYILFIFGISLAKNFIYSEDDWYSITSPKEISNTDIKTSGVFCFKGEKID